MVLNEILGNDNEININMKDPEFSEWQLGKSR